MLNLLTGQPGNGKTLWIIRRILDLCAKEQRPVFYSGIPLTEEGKAKLGWTELGDIAERVETFVDPEDNAPKTRFTLPPKAIVVIDEAQRIYRVRSQGSKVPPHVAAFETHRHQGLDFFLLTQHPQLIDTEIRKLTGYHYHVRRPSGLHRTNVYEWEQCETDPLSDRSKKLARHSMWSFDTSIYPLYTSAEVHTHKRNLPVKYLIIGGAALAVVVGSIGFVIRHMRTGAGVPIEQTVADTTGDTRVAGETGGSIDGSNRAAGVNPWSVEARAPRLDGLVRTAPMYDELQRVRSQPVITGCMEVKSQTLNICRCTTSQGSVVPVDRHQCALMIRNGWFDETRSVLSAKEENIRYLNARDSSRGQAGANPAPAGPTASPAS